jgi:hypothetical protein
MDVPCGEQKSDKKVCDSAGKKPEFCSNSGTLTTEGTCSSGSFFVCDSRTNKMPECIETFDCNSGANKVCNIKNDAPDTCTESGEMTAETCNPGVPACGAKLLPP